MTFKGLASVGPPFFIGIIAKAPRLPEFFGRRGVIFFTTFLSPHLKNKGIKRSLEELLSKVPCKIFPTLRTSSCTFLS